MTMPSVIAQHREKVTVTRLQQIYNLLQQATLQMIEDEGTIDGFATGEIERTEEYIRLLPKYLNVIKICPAGNNGCVPFEYKGIGYTWADNHANMYLNNGMLLSIKKGGGDCTQDMTLKRPPCTGDDCSYSSKFSTGTYVQRCGAIWVDLNGKQGPNIAGNDFFEFVIVKDGIVPAGLPQEVISGFGFEGGCVDNEFTSKCTAWVIHNKNMDYLHCPDKLGWDKALSCK